MYKENVMDKLKVPVNLLTEIKLKEQSYMNNTSCKNRYGSNEI